jgi:hypothetical protein
MALSGARIGALRQAPTWLWGEPAVKDDKDRLARLASPEIRARVEALLAVMDECGAQELPQAMSDMQPSPDTEGGNDSLAAAVRRHLQVDQALASAAEEHRTWISAGRELGEDPVQLQRSLERLETLRRRVSPQTFVRLVRVACEEPGQEARDRRIRACIKAVDAMAAFMGDESVNASPVVFDRQFGSLLQAPAVADESFTVGQHSFGERNAKAPLAYRALPQLPYGEVLVPVEIRSQELVDVSFKVQAEHS